MRKNYKFADNDKIYLYTLPETNKLTVNQQKTTIPIYFRSQTVELSNPPSSI